MSVQMAEHGPDTADETAQQPTASVRATKALGRRTRAHVALHREQQRDRSGAQRAHQLWQPLENAKVARARGMQPYACERKTHQVSSLLARARVGEATRACQSHELLEAALKQRLAHGRRHLGRAREQRRARGLERRRAVLGMCLEHRQEAQRDARALEGALASLAREEGQETARMPHALLEDRVPSACHRARRLQVVWARLARLSRLVLVVEHRLGRQQHLVRRRVGVRPAQPPRIPAGTLGGRRRVTRRFDAKLRRARLRKAVGQQRLQERWHQVAHVHARERRLVLGESPDGRGRDTLHAQLWRAQRRRRRLEERVRHVPVVERLARELPQAMNRLVLELDVGGGQPAANALDGRLQHVHTPSRIGHFVRLEGREHLIRGSQRHVLEQDRHLRAKES